MIQGLKKETANQELQLFIEQHLTSGLKIDLLSFFYRNPYVIGQLEDLAICLGVNMDELAGDLEELVTSGILRKKHGDATVSYALAPTQRNSTLITAFPKLFSTHQPKHAVIYRPPNPQPKISPWKIDKRQYLMEEKQGYASCGETSCQEGMSGEPIDESVLRTELELLGEVTPLLTGEEKAAVIFYSAGDCPHYGARGVGCDTALAVAEKIRSLSGSFEEPALLHGQEYPWLKECSAEELNSIALVQLGKRETMFGFLLVFNPAPGILQDRGFHILTQLAGQAVQHLKNMLLLQRYQHFALIDELTGLYNYRFFQQRLLEEISRAKRHGTQLSLMLADIDHFKQINDTFGHLEGNLVLQKISAILKNELRQTDVICRFGGEEFAVLLPGVDIKEALSAAERIRQAVAEGMLSGGKRRITVSIGVSSYSKQAAEPEKLVQLADLALYRAKNSGRNRCCSFC